MIAIGSYVQFNPIQTDAHMQRIADALGGENGTVISNRTEDGVAKVSIMFAQYGGGCEFPRVPESALTVVQSK